MVFQRVLYWVFLTTVFLAPLPFASNRPWSWSLLCLIIALLILTEAVVSFLGSKNDSTYLRRIWPGLALWSLVAVWITIQSITGLSLDTAHPLFSEASALLGQPSAASISLDTNASLTALMRLLSYGGVFWLSTRLFGDADNAALALRSIVIASALYALYGLVEFFSGTETILWFDKWAYRGNLTSTFVNRNTYATFAGLGLLASIVLLFQTAGRYLVDTMTARELFQVFVERVFSRTWLPVSALLLTATALLLTHSRGGLLSAALAIFVITLTLSIVQAIPKKIGLGLIAVTLAGSAFAFTLSADIVIERLERTSFETSIRDEVYLRAMDAIWADPLVGSGYGTFQKAFKPYKTQQIMRHNWDKAHNSYLELASEIGLPAAFLLVLSFVWLLAVYIYGLIKRRRRKEYAALGLAATCLVGTHAMVDFSLQIPGLAVFYALIAGLAWSQSWPTRTRRMN